MPVDIRSEAPLARGYARALQTDALELLHVTRLEACELSVLLLDDRGIQKLNRRFRNENRATDVLSFSQLEEGRGRAETVWCASNKNGSANRYRDEPPATLGDIVISIETAARQALDPRPVRRPIWRGTVSVENGARERIARRLRSLLIHGFLHLLGYDHERSASQARLMFLREHELELALAAAESRQLRMRVGR